MGTETQVSEFRAVWVPLFYNVYGCCSSSERISGSMGPLFYNFYGCISGEHESSGLSYFILHIAVIPKCLTILGMLDLLFWKSAK